MSALSAFPVREYCERRPPRALPPFSRESASGRGGRTGGKVEDDVVVVAAALDVVARVRIARCWWRLVTITCRTLDEGRITLRIAEDRARPVKEYSMMNRLQKGNLLVLGMYNTDQIISFRFGTFLPWSFSLFSKPRRATSASFTNCCQCFMVCAPDKILKTPST